MPTEPGSWWWLSFVDTDQPYKPEEDYPGGPRHLGVCIIFAPSFELAIGGSWVHGCNPGGQVAGYQLPDGIQVPPHRVNVLIGPDDATAVSDESLQWLPDAETEGKPCVEIPCPPLEGDPGVG